MLVIWLTCYGKENNGNLKVLKPDSYYSLWLDHNNLSSSMCSGNLFCVSDNITWFSLPYFRYELLSLKKYMSILSKALVPKCTKSYYFILKHFYMYISIYKIYSLCKGILPPKDLHPPTEISTERKDISEKKT